MDQMARELAEQAHFLFVYAREAHPDEFPDHPTHHSLKQKFQHARDMVKRHGTPRQVLVDHLDGDVHRLYGGALNSTWILDHTGHIAYKAAWTVAMRHPGRPRECTPHPRAETPGQLRGLLLRNDLDSANRP